jgi:small subunit ribosomal protein S8
MNMTDPIADMLTRLRNANGKSREKVMVPASREKVSVAEALKREGYIQDFKVVEAGVQKELWIYLKYGPNGEHVIQEIVRRSKPGRRVYRGAKEIDKVMDGMGVTILSTPKGILSDREARKSNVGGEVLFTVC